MIAEGALIADRYRVLGKLGQGGMGQVYLAEHVRMGRKSAVKIMNPGMAHDPDAVSRFNREAENACRINHTNVASVYDFGETSDGLLFLAMEYVDGKPLSAVIAQEGALSLKRATSIARQVAAALRVAHHLGIVHRDLKPDNIMITRDIEGEELVKVVDFGIAKAVAKEGQKVTRTGLSIGTPEFMSPEQLASENVDARSDIYSLGLVTFSMLTGQLPFPLVTTRETLVARLVDPPATLASVRPDIGWPTGIQAVMDKVLASKAEDRYQDAADFAKELVSSMETAVMPASGIRPSAAMRLAQQVSGARTVISHEVEAPVPAPPVPAMRPEPAPRPSSTAVLPARGGRWKTIGAVVGVLLVAGVIALVTQRDRLTARSARQARRTTVVAPVRRAPDAPPVAVAGATAPTPPTPTPPARAPAVRMTPATIVADDLAVIRRAVKTGDRERFQNAYRKGAAVISQLIAARPYDPRVRAARTEMIELRDSLRTACRRNPAPCEAVGLSVPTASLRNRTP